MQYLLQKKLLKENLFSGEDLFSLVDEINVWLKDELEIPLHHIENTEDLPVSEILTNSIPALTNFFDGYNAVAFENDWAKGLGLLEQSIQEDETFAFAYLNLYLFYALTSQGQKYMQTFQPLCSICINYRKGCNLLSNMITTTE